MTIEASYWKQNFEDNFRYTVQIEVPATFINIDELHEMFCSWSQSGTGFNPHVGSKIYIFFKEYDSEETWATFRKDKKLDELLQLKEVE